MIDALGAFADQLDLPALSGPTVDSTRRMLINIGAINYLFVRTRRVPLWEIDVPILGIAVHRYTLYKNVQGGPFPFSRFPLVVGIWLVVGLAIVLVSPGLSRRIGASSAREAEVEQPSS